MESIQIPNTTCINFVSGFVVHLVLSSDAKPINTEYSLTSNNENNLSAKENEQQVVALTMKLAELQSQVLRLNALGERLAERLDLVIIEPEIIIDVGSGTGTFVRELQQRYKKKKVAI